MIGYGCCVGWWDEFHRYVVPQVRDRRVYGDGPQPDRQLVAISGATSIATAYNQILDVFDPQGDLEALILLHTDLEITDPQGEAQLVAAVQDPTVAIAGVAGGGGQLGTQWWDCDPIGHQTIDIAEIDFAGGGPWSGPPERTRPRARAGDVDVLEGSLLVFSPWAVRHLRFDETLPGFHGYDEICLQARHWTRDRTTEETMRCVVVDVDTHHHTQGGFKGDQSREDWATANRAVREKWSSI